MVVEGMLDSVLENHLTGLSVQGLITPFNCVFSRRQPIELTM